MFAFSTALWLLLNCCKLYKVKTISNVSPELRLFSLVKTFLLSWEFSTELRLFSWFETFPLSWDLSPELRIFYWVKTSPKLRVFFWVEIFFLSWEFFIELRIFYWVETFLLIWNFSPELIIFSPLSKQSHLGYLWLPTPHYAALVWLTEHHVIPMVIKPFPPNLYPERQRISLGVTSILSICLCSHA